MGSKPSVIDYFHHHLEKTSHWLKNIGIGPLGYQKISKTSCRCLACSEVAGNVSSFKNNS
jgi:hypothetical protein